jgi:hypothetical protein
MRSSSARQEVNRVLDLGTTHHILHDEAPQTVEGSQPFTTSVMLGDESTMRAKVVSSVRMTTKVGQQTKICLSTPDCRGPM